MFVVLEFSLMDNKSSTYDPDVFMGFFVSELWFICKCFSQLWCQIWAAYNQVSAKIPFS